MSPISVSTYLKPGSVTFELVFSTRLRNCRHPKASQPYCARNRYGKDAEAAMALSLGKPVIFYCNQERRSRFYREVHPLSRLIEFGTGVAVGAMVTDTLSEVSELLLRIFENKMEYVLDQSKPGHLRLLERLTDSVVRLQSSDRMLTETFWNHYHNCDAAKERG